MEKGANTYRMIRIGEGRFLVFPLFPSDFDPRVVPPQDYAADRGPKTQREQNRAKMWERAGGS